MGCDTFIESGGVFVQLRRLIGGKLLRASPDPLKMPFHVGLLRVHSFHTTELGCMDCMFQL